MSAIIVVRTKEDDGTPNVPTGWLVNYEDAGWSTIYTPSGQVIHAWLAVDGADVGQPTRGVWVLVSPVSAVAERLRSIADASPNAWTLAELRSDSGALATAVKGAWKDQRQRDDVGDPIDDGRPLAALRSTIAGFAHHTDEKAP